MFNKLINKYLVEYSNATETDNPPPPKLDPPKRKTGNPPKRNPPDWDRPKRDRRTPPKAGGETEAPTKPAPTKPREAPHPLDRPGTRPDPGKRGQPRRAPKAEDLNTIASENGENYENNEYVQAALARFRKS